MQNAEDAKAKEIRFILDERKFGKESLLDAPAGKEGMESLQVRKMKKFMCADHTNFHPCQGPALYVYNDAEFTEKDWKGIIRPHNSHKENNPEKVGKFGIGFSSVFHITG